MKRRTMSVFALLVAGAVRAASTPQIVSSQVRASDPTVLDVVYRVVSDKPTVKVRALAFEDGKRSFLHVKRPTTFVDGTAAGLGDGIAANVEHTLSWRVSSDWNVDLAHAKFEILTSEMGQLPMKWVAIPATAENAAFTVSCGPQTEANVFNAMLWYYASGEADLHLENGYLTATNHALQADGTHLVDRDACRAFSCVEYIYDKMGVGVLNGAAQGYARRATHKELVPEGVTVYGYKRQNAPASIRLEENAYCVIDVSAGPTAQSYPVSYLASTPTAGWGDEYRTTKILLRRIGNGTFNMCGRMTSVTKPFYAGVFLITQKQYELVTGSNPSLRKGDRLPVESVSWNMIRGDSDVHDWPRVKTVDASTFVGLVRARTGLSVDLPTEAQWEHACRAGETREYGLVCDLELSALSNGWGLYEMLDDINEWCLDWYGDIDARRPAVDPDGPTAGTYRVMRGSASGFYDNYATGHRSRYGPSGRDGCCFRLVWTIDDGT